MGRGACWGYMRWQDGRVKEGSAPFTRKKLPKNTRNTFCKQNEFVLLSLETWVLLKIIGVFQDRMSLWLCPGTHKDPPASAAQVLRLKACTTTAGRFFKLLIFV